MVILEVAMEKRYKILNKDKLNCFRVRDTYTNKIVARAMSIDAIHSKWHKLEQQHRINNHKKEQ